MAFDISIKDPLERVQKVFNDLVEANNPDFYGTPLLPYLKPLTAVKHSPSTATCTFQFHGHKSLSNNMGYVHGGCAATVLDLLTSLAIAPVAAPGFWEFAGVSRTLNMTWLKPVLCNTDVVVHCEVLSIGKRLAVIRGEIRTKDGEKLVVCEHGKVGVGGGSKV